jgi:hypothetical protein
VKVLKNLNHENIQVLQSKLEELETQYWIEYNLFSFQWWLLLIVLILPWVIWSRYVERKRRKEILLFGALLIILVGLLDELGISLNLWSYPYKLTNLIPRLTAIDYGMIIVAHMFIYQYFREWKSFIIANMILAAIFTFIAEPITVWLGIYKLDNWEYIYSFPIYILKTALIKWIVDVHLEKP